VLIGHDRASFDSTSSRIYLPTSMGSGSVVEVVNEEGCTMNQAVLGRRERKLSPIRIRWARILSRPAMDAHGYRIFTGGAVNNWVRV